MSDQTHSEQAIHECIPYIHLAHSERSLVIASFRIRDGIKGLALFVEEQSWLVGSLNVDSGGKVGIRWVWILEVVE